MRSEPFTQRHVGPETTRQTVRAFTGNVWIPVLWLVALAVGTLGWAVHAAGSSGINPPLGPYVDLKPADFAGTSSFTTNDRVVLTPYFYWYDAYSQAHLINGDGSDALTDHPPTLTGFSYLSRAWHKTQLTDMIDAGIDLYVIGKIVGHTNATMTERYGHLVKGRDQEAVEKLPDWEKAKGKSAPLFPGPETRQ